MKDKKVYDLKLFINNFKMDPNKIDETFNKIESILNEEGILLDDVCFIDTDLYKNIKLTLNNVMTVLGYDKKDCLNSCYVNWDAISRYSDMTEGFIRYFKDKLNWTLISERYSDGEFKFTKKFKNEFNILLDSYNLGDNTTIPYSNETFNLKNNHTDFPMKGKARNIYSEDDNEYEENITPQDIRNILNNGNINNLLNESFGVLFSSNKIPFINLGGPEHQDDDIESNKAEEDITKIYIDLDNYKDLLIDINKYDRNMWSFLSRKCNLSPRFIELFDKNIIFGDIMNNPYFNDMMKDDRFFDKYINKFNSIKKSQKAIRLFKARLMPYHPHKTNYKGCSIPIEEL